MKKFELISFATADELALRVASLWLDEIEKARHSGKPYCVALSGGRITQKFFAAVVERAKARQLGDGGTPSLPGNVHFFWADERCVPPNDPESNFKLADDLLFKPLKIPGSQIHRVRGEDLPAVAVKSAEEELGRIASRARFSPSLQQGKGRGEEANFSNPHAPTLSPLGRGEGVNSRPILDIIFLGMGEDGHVASLFPNTPVEVVNSQEPFLFVDNSPKPPPRRVSLSYAAIAAARQVWVLISGAGKEQAFHESLDFSGKTPLARVIQTRQNTRIFSEIRPN